MTRAPWPRAGGIVRHVAFDDLDLRTGTTVRHHLVLTDTPVSCEGSPVGSDVLRVGVEDTAPPASLSPPLLRVLAILRARRRRQRAADAAAGREPRAGRRIMSRARRATPRGPMTSIEVVPVTVVGPALVEAVRRLLPQLSASAAAPDLDDLQAIVATPGTTMLLAREAAGTHAIVGMLTLVTFRIASGLRAWIEERGERQRARARGGRGQPAAIERARDQGARTVELTSRPQRTAANALYQKLGFIRRDTTVYRLAL